MSSRPAAVVAPGQPLGCHGG